MNKLFISAVMLLWLMICNAPAQAQQGGYTVSGQLNDTTGKLADAATAVLVNAADSAVIKMTLADEQGRYLLEKIPDGSYRLWVTMIGYTDYKSDIIQVAGKDVNLPVISLRASRDVLQEVSITARKSFVERKVDRTVVNVDALIANAGTTALDVLEKSPGVRVDQDGSISLQGKQGVIVFIDDKPTYMSGTDLQSYLRSLPSSTLEQIELMPNPPARYDAAGSAGIINIKTKRNKTRGFNSNLNLAYSQGKYARSNNSLNLNIREGRINAFINLAYSRSNRFNDLDIYRRYKNEDGSTKSYFRQNTYIKEPGNAYSARAGVDFYQSEKTTWGIQLNGQLRNARQTNDNTSNLLNAAERNDSLIKALNTERSTFRNAGANINYRHRFNKDGHEITADLDYILYNTGNEQVFNNTTYMPDGAVSAADRLNGSLPATIYIYSAKADYTRPLKEGYVLSGGLKTSYIKTDNLAEYLYTKSNVTVPDYDKSNHFIYKENISAAYLNMSKDFNRLSVQAGLRLEHTLSDGHQLGNIMKADSAFNRSYASLFPTLFLLYKLDSASNNVLSLNYGRRINRPYYQDLNPFISPLDKFTYYVGNPFLKPAFTNSVQLAYTYRNQFTLTMSYSNTRDEVNETIEMLGNTYYSRPGNIGRSIVKSISLDANPQTFSWLDLHGYTEVTNIHSRSDFYTGLLDTKGTYWFIQANAQVRLGKGWAAEISGRYITDVTNAQFISKANGGLNAGLQKTLGKSAMLRLNVSDIFYTSANNGIINNLALTDAHWTNKYDTRQCTLSFSYRFGKDISNVRRHDANGAETEQGRVKN